MFNNLKNVSYTDYEAQTKSFIKDFYTTHLDPDSVVYDLGAFKGILTIAFAQLGYNVIAVEGSRRNYYDLVDNTLPYPKVRPILCALHEKNIDSVRTRFNDCLALDHPEQEIKYRTLPALIEEYKLPLPNFIKMDIEGMETLVLKLCTELFTTVRPIWQLSVHDTEPHSITCVYDNFPGFVPVSKGGFDFNEIFDYGYKAYLLDGTEVTTIGGFEEYFLVPN